MLSCRAKQHRDTQCSLLLIILSFKILSNMLPNMFECSSHFMLFIAQYANSFLWNLPEAARSEWCGLRWMIDGNKFGQIEFNQTCGQRLSQMYTFTLCEYMLKWRKAVVILTKVVEDYKRSRSTVVSHLRRKFSDGKPKQAAPQLKLRKWAEK